MAVLPYTELEAVNLILRNMGEAPVNSLINPPLDVAVAIATLKEISFEVQKRGWYFNTEILRLSPDVSGFITLPMNTLHVETTGPSRGTRVVNRGGKLYRIEPYNNGDVFTAAVAIKIVFGLDFNDLPAAARSYVAIRAARVAQVRSVGDAMSAQDDSQDEVRAMAELHAEQLSAEKLSLKNSISVSGSLYGAYNPQVLQ